jgi:hypothetical protein
MPPFANTFMRKRRTAATGAVGPIVNPFIEPKQGDP